MPASRAARIGKFPRELECNRLNLWHIQNHGWNKSNQWRPLLASILAAEMQTENDQLLAHFQACDAQPAGGFGLIALG
jgi:hypothetical protein